MDSWCGKEELGARVWLEMVQVTGIETSCSWTARVQGENLEAPVRERAGVLAGMEEEAEAHIYILTDL